MGACRASVQVGGLFVQVSGCVSCRNLMRGRPGQTRQTIGDAGRQVAPGLDWPHGVVVIGDCRRGQAVQPAVMAISRPVSAVPCSYIWCVT